RRGRSSGRWSRSGRGWGLLSGAVRPPPRAGPTSAATRPSLRCRRAILARRDQSTRIDRVQNVNTTQRPLDRLLNVGTVDFDTAGTEAQEASFRFWGVAAPHDLARVVETFLAQLRERAQAPGDGGSA